MKLNLTKAIKDHNEKNPNNKITKKELAKKVGCTSQLLTNLDTEDKFPSNLKTIVRICQVLGVSLKSLISGEDKDIVTLTIQKTTTGLNMLLNINDQVEEVVGSPTNNIQQLLHISADKGFIDKLINQ